MLALIVYLIYFIVCVAILGVIVWAIEAIVPMSPPFQTALRAGAAVLALLILLYFVLGIWPLAGALVPPRPH